MDGEGRKDWPPSLARYLAVREPEPALHVGAVCIFSGPIEADALRAAIAAGVERHPRFRQVRRGRFFATYEEAPRVDVEPQIRFTRAAPPGGDAELARAASEVWSRRFDLSRPLWDVTRVDGLAENRCAILVRVHRSLATDAGVVAAVSELLGARSGLPGGRRAAPAMEAAVPSAIETIADALTPRTDLAPWRASGVGRELARLLEPGAALASARGLARQLEAVSTLVASPAPETPLNAATGPARRLGWIRLSRDVLVGIESAIGAGTEDVLLSIVADALGRYLRHRGRTTVALELMALVRRADAAGLDAGSALAPIPVGELPPAERCEALAGAMRDEHHRARLADFDALASICLTMPAPLRGVTATLCHQAANLLCVEIGGAAPRIDLQRRRLRHIVPIASLPWNTGLSVTCAASSADEVVVAVNAAADLVPDLEVFEDCVRRAYVEIASAAGVPAIDPRRLTA